MSDMKKTPSTDSKVVFRKIALGAFLSVLGCFGFFILVYSGIIRPSNKYLENFIEAPIPDDATKHVGGRCQDQNTGKLYSISIDQSNPDSYIIYLGVSCC